MLLSRYKHKLVGRELLKEMIGAFPRESKVVMCNGVFDIVHPGHVNHLLYAKSKADILVVCLTADRFIKKGIYRPHVPAEMRALNLAAFEMVDYVLIDENERPDETIKFLQPDFYAKGFEYSATMRGKQSIGEEASVASYGGEVLFTPGDFIMSSSALMRDEQPNLSGEKLALLMEGSGTTFDKLRKKVRHLSGYKVRVVGDTIVDSLTYCSMIGGQTKTPTISARFEKKVDFVGGAAVVAKHLAAAGAEVILSTVIGDDELGAFVLDDLHSSGVSVSHIVDRSRPTTNKNAIVIGGYRMLKVDTLDNRSISDKILNQMAEELSGTMAHAVIFSDFRHGIFNRRTIDFLREALPKGIFRVADSQVASRWGNILDFRGFEMITPNEREARFALGDQDSGIRPLASMLYDQAQCGTLMLKLGEKGILTCASASHEASDSFCIVDSFAERVVDAVGAGDAMLAYATLSMLIDRNAVEATILGAVAAAVECEYEGNIPVGPQAVLSKLDRLEGAIP